MEIYDLIANLFNALSHPLRVKIIESIGEKGICVTELSKHIKEGQPQVSRALSILKQQGLVMAKRVKKRTCYSVSNKKVIELLNIAKLIIGEKSYKISKIIKQGGE